jgi:outer membrane protein insertion porin family
MTNILSKFLFIFLFFTNYSFSELIKDIEVNGNKRISKDSIILFSGLKTNVEYDINLINDSLKNIYNTNFFEDVKISFSNSKILIDIIEYPVINKFEINGIKKSSFLEFITNNINLRVRSSFNENILQSDLKLIENILNSNGYYFSKISTNLDLDKELNTVNLIINIDLGNKAKIRKIKFIGNKIFKDKTLIQIIGSEENKFWKFISKNVFLNKQLILLDKRLLEKYYKNRGYYNIKITDNFVQYDNKNESFDLTYNIDAGNKFIINQLSMKLPEDYLKDDFTKIFETFEKNEKSIYSLDFIDDIIVQIENIASNKSYEFIDVIVEEKIVDENKLDFNFIVSDSKKYYIEKINFIGNYSTIEEVLRNQLVVDEGDPLNNLLYEKSLNNLRSLGFFNSVKSNIENGSNDNFKIIEINVEEKPTGEISVAAGYGTTGFATGGHIIEKNFLGKGIYLDTNIEINRESIKGQITYSVPNFAYTDNSLSASLRSINNDFLNLYGYETNEYGFSIGTRFEQYEKLFFKPELDFNIEELSTNSTASNNLRKQEGTYKDLYFNYGLNYDLRNSNYNPSSGYFYDFYQELPLVSKNNEILNTFIFTKYKELDESSEMVGRASFYLNSINTMDGSDVRISKRSNVPYNRLRGFEKGKVGPIDNSDYIGGNYVSTLNLSTNLPNLFPALEIFDFNYFIDFANVWGVDYDSSLDKSKLRSSTGIGLNVATPIGPLSFSLTQPITKASTDKTENFRFNLGTTF